VSPAPLPGPVRGPEPDPSLPRGPGSRPAAEAEPGPRTGSAPATAPGPAAGSRPRPGPARRPGSRALARRVSAGPLTVSDTESKRSSRLSAARLGPVSGADSSYSLRHQSSSWAAGFSPC
ncbi:hypothetical protein B5180_32935, partial [Streptomyces sp. BF-3]